MRDAHLPRGRARSFERPRSQQARSCAVAVAVAIGLFVTTTAEAQDDPYATGEQAAKENELDTDVTPVAKNTDLWGLLHGAEYPDTEVIEGSVTTFSTDLHAVGFQNRSIGLAAGSRCTLEPVQQKTEDDEDFGARVTACEGTDGSKVARIPALYRYAEPKNEDPRWEELDLPGEAKPGYIGALAWIDADRALLVGGTGTYPRREQTDDGKASTDPEKRDVAGEARAWVYHRATASSPERVEEIPLSSLTSQTTAEGEERAGMRGLTAVDCYEDPNPKPDEKPVELCLAGALGQLWEFRDGAFVEKRIDALSPDSELKDAPLFRYRVRDIAFMPLEPPMAAAVTAGCCAANDTQNTPRVLIFDGDTAFSRRGSAPGPSHKPGPSRWFARDFYERASINPTNPLPPSVDTPGEVTTPGSVSPEDAGQGWVCFWVPSSCPTPVPGGPQTLEVPGGPQKLEVPGGGKPVIPTETEHDRRETNDKPLWPDSIYSLTMPATTGNPSGSATGFSAILTPGGAVNEKPSVITSSSSGNAEGQTPRSTSFSTARLLDGDGDSASEDPRRISGLKGSAEHIRLSGGDGVPDWAVGELRSSTRGALGAQGLAVSTTLAPEAVDALNEGRGTTPPSPEEVAQGEYEAVDQETLKNYIRSQHYLLPSYTANAIDVVGDDEDAWMVGDHGAIVRRDAEAHGAGQAAFEPKPPRLGAAREKSLSDRSAYEGSRPELPSSAGVVPPLGAETVELDEPEMVGMGSVGPVDRIVTSRDGSEGWAIGRASGGGPSFTYFDGRAWSRCDPLGIPGEVEPDPACEAMAPLRGYRRGGQGALQRVDLTHMARVPLENDPDPTNDDELEIVAMGERYGGPEYKGESLPAVVRYADGRWRFEEPEAVRALNGTVISVSGNGSDTDGIVGLAFVAPNDGWLVTRVGAGSGATARLYRFDGLAWTECLAQPGLCQENGLIPDQTREIAGLAAAGERVYLYGSRETGVSLPVSQAGDNCVHGIGVSTCTTHDVPLILYHDPAGGWTDGSGEGQDGGGFDPGFSDPATQETGRVDSLSVVEGPDGYEGWAVGEFGGVQTPTGGGTVPHLVTPQTALMQVDPTSGRGWQRFQSPGALDDYMKPNLRYRLPTSHHGLQVSYPSGKDPGEVFIGQADSASAGSRIFVFDPARERFELVDSARPQASAEHVGEARPVGELTAMAPDGAGGFWAAAGNHMFHYTDEPPKQPFEEASNPLGTSGSRLKALSGAPDGSVWAATDSDRLYRYDRLTGWEQARVGWDPGRVVTRSSQANEIAIGPNGEGLVVGEGGRIAELSPTSVVLDAAAGRSCALGDAIPCGTSRDLHAVDVAPDGSAIAGGDRLSLLWRPAGGEFRTIAQQPQIGSSTQITAVSMPSAERAYLATSAGIVFGGTHLGSGSWEWEAENVDDRGETISIGELRDVAVDETGHGYAVGSAGILERSSDGEWRKLPARYGAATAVELPQTGGPGVLIGAEDGRILAGEGSELHLVRPDDFRAGGRREVVGFAYLPGSAQGTVDAWAGIAPVSGSSEGDSRLLRHRSNPTDPLLDPSVAAAALPDAPAHSDSELSLAAFGKSDCDQSEDNLCPEFSATTTTNEVVTDRIVDELSSLRESGELDLAVQSGDATDSAGLDGSSLADVDRIGGFSGAQTVNFPPRSLAGQLKHRRYAEMVAEELEENGIPAFAAIGSQDLSETYACPGVPGGTTDCPTSKRFANAGENYGWREAFAGRTDPWGDGSGALETDGELELEPAPGSANNSLRTEDQRADADGEGTAPEAKAEIGGASTHYALDAVKDGEAIARIVFVDTSLRSLAASDSQQQPHELGGGQQRFLERMICKEGQSSTFGDRCTREKDQKAIVVSNTPTYSYGPGALTHTATDATTFEATMLRYDVDLVISGALGYNGLYYTLAPGLHEPCPGAGHPEGPPTGKTPDCLDAATSTAGVKAPDPNELVSIINAEDLRGAYPTLISSGAGGKFGPDGTEGPSGPEGRWHGYSVARLMPDGDIAVEQRPILDWIGLEASRHMIRPREKLLLNGYGRSPISTRLEGGTRAFHYEISTAAITHRYDLLRADPEKPWLPLEDVAAGAQADGPDACEAYVCLPSEVATVDGQSGQVKAGSGKHPPTYALAMLSVGDEVTTTPLFFQPSPSFRFEAPTVPRPTPAIGSVAPPGSPSTPSTPSIPNVSVPTPPVPPALVPPPPAPPATPPQPPVPPPVPPADAGPSALSLSFAPAGLVVAPTASVIPPPAPPINPAPPGGARKEARQRQAAAQKSGADGDAQEQADDAGGDLAQGPHGPEQAMTRLEATRAELARASGSFTPLARDNQPSAWTRGALYGGGMTLMAFALAIGWTHGRPTPRRRAPHVPAPAQAAARRPKR